MAKTIDAIFQKGIIKPLGKVDLYENERIKLQIFRSPEKHTETKPKSFASLRGILKGTLDISEAEIEEAKHIWEKGLEKETQFLREEN